MNARHAAAALAAALLAAPPAQAAPRTGPLRAEVVVAGGRATATLDLAPAFDPALGRRLGNGLTNVVAVLVVVVPEAGGPPAATVARVAEVLFDVWDETYAVALRDSRRGGLERHAVPHDEALRRLLADAGPVDLGPAGLLPPGGFRLEVRVEVNPISRELMQRTRELLANPASSGRPGAGSRSVLGAVAGYLLRDPGPGDDLILLRSRRFPGAEAALP